jgi:hypothetical protein
VLPGKPVFRESEHTYHIGEWEVPGTGDIMKVGGELEDRWYNLSGRTRGQVIHHLTYQLDLGLVRLEDVETQYQSWILAYGEFKLKHRPRYKLLEQPVFNEHLGFATVLDRAGIGMLDKKGKRINGWFELNIKTGAPEDWHGVQRAGEVIAWRKKPDFHIRRYTLYLKKTGKFAIEEHPYEGDYDIFTDCLIKWRRECHDPKRHGPLSLLKPLRSKKRLSAFRRKLRDSVASGSRRSGRSTPSRTQTGSALWSSTTRRSTPQPLKLACSVRGSRKR